MATNPGLSPRKCLLRVTPSPPESPDQLQGSWPGGGRLTGGAGGAAACCWGGGGGGGGGGLGASIGLHCATLSLRLTSSATSSALSLLSSACASSSEAFRTGVGSG